MVTLCGLSGREQDVAQTHTLLSGQQGALKDDEATVFAHGVPAAKVKVHKQANRIWRTL